MNRLRRDPSASPKRVSREMRYAKWLARQTSRDARQFAHRGYTRTLAIKVGAGTIVQFPAVINGRPFVTVGDGTLIRRRASLNAFPLEGHPAPRLTIGDGCDLGDNLLISCALRVSIGNAVLASQRVYIGDNNHDFTNPTSGPVGLPCVNPRPVRIGDGAFLGIGCAVMPGVTIGERAVIGANAVVTSDVEAWTMVAGIPARPVKRWDGQQWVTVRSA
jgi:serine acetyltransferase